MSTCCKTINPLRRDGTSQRQRFPLTLAEGYVQIDERSHADILNFIRKLAEDFNYYAANNQVQDTWVEFFQDDLSFLLAQNVLVQVQDYRDTFAALVRSAIDELGDPFVLSTGFPNKLEAVFAAFLTPVPSVHNTATLLEPLPAMIDNWIALLPESGLFADDAQYSFKDLVLEGRTRLSAALKKLETAHWESESVFSPTTNSLGLWAGLKSAGWNIYDVPVTFPYVYYTSADQVDDLPRIFELLTASMDALTGMIESFQASVPYYLQQSLEKFPWHNPQNALFLAFLQLFDHAKAHVNSLGRKHLLYEYMEVLRFTHRPLVADQAIVKFELRKGEEQFLLKAGTLLKAGKDVDGNALSYAVDTETVINKAVVRALHSVHVQRDTNKKVLGLYSAEIANSADGMGAPLAPKDPKWNMFGEAQLTKLPAERSMQDARMGFAIASPLFVMKEGLREITVNFVIKQSSLSAIFNAPLPNSLPAQTEANLLQALKVSYTHPKGWADAKLVSVFLVDIAQPVGQIDKCALTLTIRLEEGDLPFVPYLEKTHLEGIRTAWPVLKLVLQGRSYDCAAPAFGLAAKGASVAASAYCLYGGNLYKNATTVPQSALINLTLIPEFATFLAAKFTLYSESDDYEPLDQVYFNRNSYQARSTINQTVSANGTSNQNPENSPALWELVGQSTMFDPFQHAEILQLNLAVNVVGVTGVLLENDFGKLKAEKPFPMFGATPVVGSRFYIGAQEIFGKQLDTLSVRLLWQDPPDDLHAHYVQYEDIVTAIETASTNTGSTCGKDCMCCPAPDYELAGDSQIAVEENQAYSANKMANPGGSANYPVCYINCPDPSYILGNGAWTADVSFLYEGLWSYLDRKTLFEEDANGKGAQKPHTISFNASQLNPYLRDLNLKEPGKLESNTPRGFLRFELATPVIAFGHKYYRDLYVKAALAYAKTGLGPYFPGEPYTPVVKEIKIDYTSKATIDFGTAAALSEVYADRIDQFFHLHPFGHTEEHSFLSKGAAMNLLPQYPDEGYLYIGLDGLVAPSTLSMLFQLAEGSADPDLEGSAPIWSILVDNQWRDLRRRDILFDSTDELIATGVMRFDFDGDFAVGNTLLSKDLHWLRARIAEHTPAYMKAVEIVAQAAVVSFRDHGNNPIHLAKALPSGTINALAINDPTVKSVVQPYGSFGGKLPEKADEFITRVSERLRHKQRSINVWDYEHMVLEQFPSIYKVKCLNHSEYKADHTDRHDWEISPGFVTIVCIPDLRNLNGVNPFEPKTSVRILKKVDAFLRNHISAWVDLKVANPLYEEISIACHVGFVAGKDPGYYTQQLDIAIQRFLSPWAFDNEKEIVFGGKIHASQIIRFIEQQDYVDYVLNFQMNHVVAGVMTRDIQEAVATTGRSILVSATTHAITSVKANCADCIPSPIGMPVTECCGADADNAG